MIEIKKYYKGIQEGVVTQAIQTEMIQARDMFVKENKK